MAWQKWKTHLLGRRKSRLLVKKRKRSGSVVECLTRDRGAAGSSLSGVTAACPWARYINPSLVLVQPIKTRPYITERLMMGRKESNPTKEPNGGKDYGIQVIRSNGSFPFHSNVHFLSLKRPFISASLSSKSAQTSFADKKSRCRCTSWFPLSNKHMA